MPVSPRASRAATSRSRTRRQSRRRRRPAPSPRTSGGRSFTSTTWPGAITVIQWHTFSSWRTLPGQSCAARNCSAASVRRLPSTPRSRALLARKWRASSGMSSRRSRSARQAQADHVEAVVEVLAEQALLHPRLEVLVGGGDHAHVRRERRVAADAVELAVGEHAQQARLQVGRHVADLVEEERAAVGLLEAPAAHRLRAGEGAALVAEELALEQVLGDRRGVDRDEGAWARAGCGGAARAPPAPCRCPTRR